MFCQLFITQTPGGYVGGGLQMQTISQSLLRVMPLAERMAKLARLLARKPLGIVFNEHPTRSESSRASADQCLPI
jgi:hypothetical protein